MYQPEFVSLPTALSLIAKQLKKSSLHSDVRETLYRALAEAALPSQDDKTQSIPAIAWSVAGLSAFQIALTLPNTIIAPDGTTFHNPVVRRSDVVRLWHTDEIPIRVGFVGFFLACMKLGESLGLSDAIQAGMKHIKTAAEAGVITIYGEQPRHLAPQPIPAEQWPYLDIDLLAGPGDFWSGQGVWGYAVATAKPSKTVASPRDYTWSKLQIKQTELDTLVAELDADNAESNLVLNDSSGYWTAAEAVIWIGYRDQRKVSKWGSDPEKNIAFVLIMISQDDHPASQLERRPLDALVSAYRHGKVRVQAQRAPGARFEILSEADLKSLDIKQSDLPRAKTILIEARSITPTFCNPLFAISDVVQAWPPIVEAPSNVTPISINEPPDNLPQWIYKSAANINPLRPGKVLKHNLYDEYMSTFPDRAREREFNAAYRQVFDTKQGSPPKSGWTVKPPFNGQTS